MRKVIAFNLQPIERVQTIAVQKNTVRIVPLEARSTERTLVQPKIDPRDAIRRESELVHSFAAWLEARSISVSRLACSIAGGESGREMFSDVYIPQRKQLVEAKGVVSREGIRMAIGQLFDYQRFAPPETRLAVLLPKHPGPDLEALLTSVKISCIWRRGAAEFADNANGAFVLGTPPTPDP